MRAGACSEPTGSVSLTYHFGEDVSAYWKYSHGFKPGHYNATTSDPEEFPESEHHPFIRWGKLTGKIGLIGGPILVVVGTIVIIAIAVNS